MDRTRNLPHATDTTTRDRTTAVLSDLLGEPRLWGVGIRLWDGTVLGPTRPRTTIVLPYPWSLRSLMWPPTELNAGEAFIFGDIDITGDIEGVFELWDRLSALPWSRPRFLARLGSSVLALPSRPSGRDASRGAAAGGMLHSRERDRAAVRYHYDVSNDFFARWLDPRMQYSCGYFRSMDDDLETAQLSKVEHICRKLRLQEGDRLLDIGCGWGGLLEHAVTHHGARGVGITLSKPQAELANERLHDAGVSDRAHVEVRDYREVDGEFDKIVSVGMVEHVGAAMLRPYFARAMRMLRPGGVFLNHGITTRWGDQGVLKRDGFMGRYVFPDGELQAISDVLSAAEAEGFEVRDVESLREHYARTLRCWVANLEAAHDEIVRDTDEVTYRIWRIYMAGSAHGFDKGGLNVFQTLLHRPCGGPSRLPPTRDDWYAAVAAETARANEGGPWTDTI